MDGFVCLSFTTHLGSSKTAPERESYDQILPVSKIPEKCFSNVKKSIKESIAECKDLTSEKLVKLRMDKFSNMGVYKE